VFHLVSQLVSLGEPNIYQNLGDLTRIWDFTWSVSDCEELVGVTYRRWWGGYFDLNIYDLIYLLSGQTRKNFLLDLCLQSNKKRNDVFFRINPRNSRHPNHKKNFLIFLIGNQFF